MINIIDKKDCVGCNACVQRCPKQCISMQEDEQGFLYPKVDLSLCIDCHLCEKVCPVINQAEPRKPIETFAAKNTDEKVRMTSSSGGIFYALAKKIIEEGGVVFGAKFNDKWEVVHDYAETLEGVKAFQGSKYVQSRIGETFIQAEQFLKSGRKVMFTGTPCQIAALGLFLRKDYSNKLLKVDVVCHGVPSPRIWRDYLFFIGKKELLYNDEDNSHENKNKSFIIHNISFRDKQISWNDYSFKLDYEIITQNEKHINGFIREHHNANLYSKLFLNNLDLRPSCYKCPAKNGNSQSDLTLGDFWKVESLLPQFYDKNGISIILNYNNGLDKNIFNGTCFTFPITYKTALFSNSSIILSTPKAKCYNQFWERYVIGGFESVLMIANWLKPTLFNRIKNRIIRALEKLH